MAQQPRILTISQKPGLFTKDLQVLDAAGAQLYDFKGCKSDQWSVVSIFNAQNPSAAQIQFHGRLRAEVSFPGRPPISLSLTGGMLDNGYSFPSRIGGPLKWSGGDSKRTLTTRGGECIAKYDKSLFGSKATLEVANGSIGVGALDEVVVTGVVVAEIIRRRKSTGI